MSIPEQTPNTDALQFTAYAASELNRHYEHVLEEVEELNKAESEYNIELQQRKDAKEKSEYLTKMALDTWKQDIEEINNQKDLSWWKRENAISIAERKREQTLASASLERMKTGSTGRYELTKMKLQIRTWLRSWFI